MADLYELMHEMEMKERQIDMLPDEVREEYLQAREESCVSSGEQKERALTRMQEILARYSVAKVVEVDTATACPEGTEDPNINRFMPFCNEQEYEAFDKIIREQNKLRIPKGSVDKLIGKGKIDG
jgi:hypothetical protein